MIKRRFAAFAALAAVAPVFAQEAAPPPDRGVTLGIALQRHELDVNFGGLARLDKSAFGYEASGGYQFSRYLAAELIAFDAGRPEASGNGASVDARIRGVTPSIVASLPIGDAFSIYGRAGYTFSRWKVHSRVGLSAVSDSFDQNEATFGAGIAFAMDSAWLRLEYDYTDWSNVGDVGGVDAKSKTLKLGVLWYLWGK